MSDSESNFPEDSDDEFGEHDRRIEGAETCKYLIISLVVLPVLGQVLAWFTYWLVCLRHEDQLMLNLKFLLIHRYQLGYVFLAVYVMRLVRAALVSLANGARAPTGVDRPDQQVYEVVAAPGCLEKAPRVLMAASGAAGRFNRAHRAVFNTDETLPLLLVDLVLTGSVFGPAVLSLALLAGVGRIVFSVLYRASAQARGAGFLLAVICEQWTAGLTLLCAIKGVWYSDQQ